MPICPYTIMQVNNIIYSFFFLRSYDKLEMCLGGTPEYDTKAFLLQESLAWMMTPRCWCLPLFVILSIGIKAKDMIDKERESLGEHVDTRTVCILFTAWKNL